MTAYVVVDIAITDPERYEEVKQRTPPIVAQYGGHYLARGGQTESLHGDWSPERLVLWLLTIWNRPKPGRRHRNTPRSSNFAISVPGSIW